MTKEEKFIIKLFEKASALGDPKYPVEAATVIEGLHPKQLKTIIQVLAAANFVRREENARLSLTDNGLRLANDLLG